jgi:hypothetical protein
MSPANEVNHRITAGRYVVVFVSPSEETATDALTTADGADGVGTIIPKDKQIDARRPRDARTT